MARTEVARAERLSRKISPRICIRLAATANGKDWRREILRAAVSQLIALIASNAHP